MKKSNDVSLTIPSVEIIYQLRDILKHIPIDFGGGAPFDKVFILSYLAVKFNLSTFVEIGVYRGRCFIPVSKIFQLLGGRSYGIDPFSNELALEEDIEDDLREQLDAFLNQISFEDIYKDVVSHLENFELKETAEIIRQTSSQAIEFFKEESISIDMIHVDGNHDTAYVMQDIQTYIPLVSPGGFVVMDDINWESVKPAYEWVCEQDDCVEIFNDESYAIFQISKPKEALSELEKDWLGICKSMIQNSDYYEFPGNLYNDPAYLETVSVVLISYNQENYIRMALEGILAQMGDYKLELIVGDDYSQDQTLDTIKAYRNLFTLNPRIEIKILETEHNHGIAYNLKRCFENSSGKYIAICEGDDYWLKDNKLQTQIDFLHEHPECSGCHHDLFIYYQEDEDYEIPENQLELKKDLLTADDVIGNYTIGNFSCCMYDTEILQNIPESIYDTQFGDWLLNIYMSTKGALGHIDQPLSVYRKHKSGVWAGKESMEIAEILHSYVKEYNRFFDYEYDQEFSRILEHYEYVGPISLSPSGIFIYDDFFPHPLSAFRMMEYLAYLKEFPDIIIRSTFHASNAYVDTPSKEFVAEFKKQYPEYANQVREYNKLARINPKVIYTIFLNLAYEIVEKAEELQVPFVFTLYPGGGFGINNAESNHKLKRVLKSPCFQKVIVTQKLTYDYLIKKGYCKKEDIEFVYGGVVPLLPENFDIEKKRFGIDKNTLDICFVATKYSKTGKYKGYDRFIKVAHMLCEQYSNIYFHVVGGHDETDIDVSAISSKIKFYGKQTTEWFNTFYKDKDIVLSPNVPINEMNGAFDGFPTGSCVDAGFRKTAIFCTDNYNLNQNYFIPDEEIVIIPSDPKEITQVIEFYYQNPELIQMIGENGYKKIGQLFDYETQISPRINILQTELDHFEETKIEIEKKIFSFIDTSVPVHTALKIRLLILLKKLIELILRLTPSRIKKYVKSLAYKLLGNDKLKSILKKIIPGVVQRIFNDYKGIPPQ